MAGNSSSGRQRLFSGAAVRAAEPVLALLGDPDRKKLDQLLQLSVSGTISLADVLSGLFQEQDAVRAQKSLGNWKRRINEIAEDNRLTFRVMTDTKTRSQPEQRHCWFEGDNADIEEAERYSDELTRDVEYNPTIPARGKATTSKAMAEGKQLVRIFVSYAHDEIGRRPKPSDQLVAELRRLFEASRSYLLEFWNDREINVGTKFDQKIQAEIASCDFGLLLISPAFLGSKYINENELPHFVSRNPDSPTKPCIPVGLEKVDFDRHDLKGLDKTQIFLGQHSPGHYYADLATRKKVEFVHQLFQKMERRFDEHFGRSPGTPPRSRSIPELRKQRPVPPELRQVPPEGDEFEDHKFPEDEFTPPDTPNFTPTRGHRFTFADSEGIADRRFESANAKDALTELRAWAADIDGCPFFAVLGEYGIGKTTPLKQFTRRLLELRKADRATPLPIYVDLRAYVSNDARGKDFVPTIQELLTTVIERSWKLTDKSITADVIIRLVREKGAIILFDGLDEKIVHMTPDRARAFIRTLWSVLPDAGRRSKGKSAAPADGIKRGKLLISCRSHYFRDVGSQNSMLAGDDREDLDRKSFPALLLLPFTEEQILTYLTSVLGSEQRATEALATIRSIHNLTDLAQRPYLLSQITERLDELECLQVKGETVNAARLYELFIKSWLNRDDGKHQIESAHKRELMEDLAAALWRSEEKQWDADVLEKWLDRFLLQHPEIAGAYAGRDRAVLKEDLRTATFVVRPDDEQNQFRFAHTSLQEFFLASYLARALRDQQPDHWDLPRPNAETLDFLGQLLQLEFKPAAVRTLNALPGDSRRRAAYAAFAYWMRAIENGYPVPRPDSVNLEDADLDDWQFSGTEDRPLRLSNVNLQGARLNRARLSHVILDKARMNGLQARNALFRNVTAMGAKALRVDFSGLRWSRGSLAGSKFVDFPYREGEAPAEPGNRDMSDREAAQQELRPPDTLAHAAFENATTGFAGCQFVNVDLGDVQFPPDWDQSGATMSRHGRLPATAQSEQAASILDIGHAGTVSSCVFSPDGTQLLSGSDDKTLKLWNVATGECLRTFAGHTSLVSSCVFSLDGTQLLSGSYDKTLKLWNVATGECLRTFCNLPEHQTVSFDHDDRIQSCTPDAWRFIGWCWTDPSTNRLRLLPAEFFGPLPVAPVS